MYAIIQTGGKQYKVSELDKIKVEMLDVEEGSEISFDVVAVSTDAGFKAGTPSLRVHRSRARSCPTERARSCML